MTWQELGIDTHGRTGGQVKTFCPKCRSDRKKHTADRSLSANLDSGVFNCHHCGWKGSVAAPGAVKTYRKPDFVPSDTPNEKLERWFADRGIPPRVVKRNKITSVLRGSDRAIAFPFYRDGQVINVKYRTADKQFSLEGGAEVLLYGLDDIDPSKPLIFVEGEIDKLSMETVGFMNCVSVPNGAGTNLDVFAAAERWLEPIKKIIWAGDSDEAGRRLEAEAIRRLGPERCYRVAWPSGCKDANEVLVKYGAEALAEYVDNARAVPIEGAFEVADVWADLVRLYECGRPRGEYPGWMTLAEYYRPRAGDWTVITGSPGSGKTVFLAALMVNLAVYSGWQFVVYPPENLPPEEYISMLIELFLGLPFGDGPRPRMSFAEMQKGAEWVQDHFVILNPEDGKRSLSDLLKIVKSYVFRRGINGFVIDPWNELEHYQPQGMTETQYIGDSLIRIRQFARINKIHTWVVVHPTKLQKENGKYPIATLYDCAGSAHWFNKADMGISVFRDKTDDSKPVEIHVQKVRFRWCGQTGMVPLFYDKVTGRYHELEASGSDYAQ